MIRRLAHASFVTDDLPRMHRFFTQAMGMPVKIQLNNADGATLGYYFDCGGTSFIEVFDDCLKQQQWNVPGRPDSRGGKYDHLCMEVSGLRAFIERLRAHGVEVGEPFPGNGGTQTVWIADPDGNRIELMEYVSTSPQVRLESGPTVITLPK